MRVRLLAANDSDLVRGGIGQIVALHDGLQVALSCASLAELIEAIERATRDVVLTDLPMPPAHDKEGIQVAVRRRDTHPETGVIVISQSAEPLLALKLFETGPGRR